MIRKIQSLQLQSGSFPLCSFKNNMIETKLLDLEDYKKTGKLSEEDRKKLITAADALAAGKLVAFPTETVYGLGGDATRADVSARIYAAKGRPSDNPLIVHISSMEELPPLVKAVPESCRKLAGAYWPGPMTLVLEKSDRIPKETTGGLNTVAIRMPVHPVAAELIRMSGVPVAAPSANRSGRPSTTCAQHCMEDLDGRVEYIVDGGPCEIGVESTIVDLTEAEPVLLRPGAVTMEMLTKVFGKEPKKDKAVVRSLAAGEKPKAPGMKYRHYAPNAPLVVVRAKTLVSDVTDKAIDKATERVCGRIAELAEGYYEEGLRAEILCSVQCADRLKKMAAGDAKYARLRQTPIRVLGSQDDPGQIARQLFAQLRETDTDAPDRLIAEGFGEQDLFLAIMNRLKKAAGWQIEEV